MVVTCVVIVFVVRVIAELSLIRIVFVILRVVVVWLESAFGLVLTLGPKASLGLAHLVEFGVVGVVAVILEDLVLLVLQVLVLQLFDDLLLLGAALAILQVVHI